MIKKNDLVKQFELVVQQEIKNYNDSLNFILQSIRDIKSSTEEIKKTIVEIQAFSFSINCAISDQIKQLKLSLQELEGTVDNHQNEQRVLNIRNSELFYKILESSSRDKESTILINKKVDGLSEFLNKIDQYSKTTRQCVDTSANDLLVKFAESISKAKREIMDKPTEAALVKVQLEDKLKSYKVDVDGIMREISVIKKSNIITDKKLENVYTLIDRLKESGETK